MTRRWWSTAHRTSPGSGPSNVNEHRPRVSPSCGSICVLPFLSYGRGSNARCGDVAILPPAVRSQNYEFAVSRRRPRRWRQHFRGVVWRVADERFMQQQQLGTVGTGSCRDRKPRQFLQSDSYMASLLEMEIGSSCRVQDSATGPSTTPVDQRGRRVGFHAGKDQSNCQSGDEVASR